MSGTIRRKKTAKGSPRPAHRQGAGARRRQSPRAGAPSSTCCTWSAAGRTSCARRVAGHRYADLGQVMISSPACSPWRGMRATGCGRPTIGCRPSAVRGRGSRRWPSISWPITRCRRSWPRSGSEAVTTSERRQGWYRHMGLGRNIRTADVPLALTKRMAHEFTMAPDHYSADMALRWGQVRGLGGEKALAPVDRGHAAGAIVRARGLLADGGPLLRESPGAGPRARRADRRLPAQPAVRGAGGLRRGGWISPDPPQPNLSMKGRTPRSLLRQVGEWHALLRQQQRVRTLRWGPSGIGEFRWVEPEEGRPELALLDDPRAAHQRRALPRRGRDGALRRDLRAVLPSAVRARSGRCGSRPRGRRHRALTIEVDPKTRTIWEAAAHHDAMPTETHRRILERWARQEGLTIEC